MFSPRMPSEVYRYRKRRQKSLDGTVAGLDRPQYHRTMGTPDAGHQFSPVAETPCYDPDPGFMDDHRPRYEEPDPWFEQQFRHHPMNSREDRFTSPTEHMDRSPTPAQMYRMDARTHEVLERMMYGRGETTAPVEQDSTVEPDIPDNAEPPPQPEAPVLPEQILEEMIPQAEPDQFPQPQEDQQLEQMLHYMAFPLPGP